MAEAQREWPIGLFDSGVGGLTVLRALRRALPHEHMVYLGDTARVPYGTKSKDSVCRYAQQAAQVLVQCPVKLLVIACNTASAIALPDLQSRYRSVPVVGVLLPGAAAAVAASTSGRIAVMATESTLRDGGYPDAIRSFRPDATVYELPCSLLVALAEEGWVRGPIVEAVIGRYLDPLGTASPPAKPDCLVLGCTHLPPLAQPIQQAVGPSIMLVDSATTTAQTVHQKLHDQNLLRASNAGASVRFLATDSATRFARIGSLFLGRQINAGEIEHVDL